MKDMIEVERERLQRLLEILLSSDSYSWTMKNILEGLLSPKPKGRQRVADGESYYIIGLSGNICTPSDVRDYFDDMNFTRGNYYNSEQEAEQADRINLATQRVIGALEIANDGWVADWSNKHQEKSYIVYNHDSVRFTIVECKLTQHVAGDSLIGSTKAWQSVIKSHEYDLRIMFDVSR